MDNSQCKTDKYVH